MSCDVLIRRRADITVSNLKDVPPLHMATRQGHWSIADALLKEGSGPEILDSAKRTPLMIASLEGTSFFISNLDSNPLLVNLTFEIHSQDTEMALSLKFEMAVCFD